MSRWLHKIAAPSGFLGLCIPVLVALSVVTRHDTDYTSADIVVQLSFPLILGVWVLADAHKRGRQLCYDYGAFIFSVGRSWCRSICSKPGEFAPSQR